LNDDDYQAALMGELAMGSKPYEGRLCPIPIMAFFNA